MPYLFETGFGLQPVHVLVDPNTKTGQQPVLVFYRLLPDEGTAALHRHASYPLCRNAGPVLCGLLASQAGATGLVREAALDLQREMTVIIARGYVAVPSPSVVKDLSRWSNAFMGGIFFTVTSGILITLITLAAVRLMQRLPWSLPQQAGFLVALWAVGAAFLNSQGLNIGPSVYVLAVMAAVATVGFVSGSHRQREEGSFRRGLMVLAPLVLLTGLWLTQLDPGLLVNIRDRLLFSNRAGIQVAQFYYDYTLLAARAMAPLSQRRLIGVDMSALAADTASGELSNALRRSDVLDVGNVSGASAKLLPDGENIRLQHESGRSVTASKIEILRHPEAVIQKFSVVTDPNAPFRLLTLTGIWIGFPVMLYLVAFTMTESLLNCFTRRHAAPAAGLACLMIGGALFYAVVSAPAVGLEDGQDLHLWQHGGPAGKISVLKRAMQQHIDPLKYPGAESLLRSNALAERYWFARSLAASPSNRGFALLEQMIHDRSFLVRCQVCYAFGESQNPKAIPLLLGALETTNHWYTQRYAYTALKKLGWTQPERSRPNQPSSPC